VLHIHSGAVFILHAYIITHTHTRTHTHATKTKRHIYTDVIFDTHCASLPGVSGICKPGHVTLLVGSEGDDKDALLHILAGRRRKDDVFRFGIPLPSPSPPLAITTNHLHYSHPTIPIFRPIIQRITSITSDRSHSCETHPTQSHSTPPTYSHLHPTSSYPIHH
jgi:hypothetical protein